MGSRAETRTWVGQLKAETPVWADTEMPSSRFTWTRPTTHIYSYNREAQNIISSRSARATSVTANESRSAMTSTSESTMRSSRAASVAATSDNFSGYSGYYGRQLAQIMQKQGPTAAAAAVPVRESLRAGYPAPTIYPNKVIAGVASASGSASASSSTSVVRSTAVSTKETTTTESKISREQVLRAQSESIEYGKRSKSQALRRAEMHAASSGKDPRHTVLPRSLGDDICKVVADLLISPYESKEVNAAKASYAQGRLKVDRMEKQLQNLTDSAMSYKSIYAKSAAQMAREAMEACEQEAASSKKVRRTVVEESSRRVAAA